MATPKKNPPPPSTKGRRGSPPAPQSRRSNTTPIVIAGVVGIVIAVGIVVALLLGGSDDKETDPAIFKPVAIDGEALPAFTAEVRESGSDPAVGMEAPVVSGVDYDGDAVTIDAAADGPTLVVLLAHWCPHCNREIPVLNDWRDSGDVPDNLNVVGVSTGIDAGRANYPPDEWLGSMDWTWPVLGDADLSVDDPADGADTAFRAYGATSFPTMILIGSDGQVLTRFSGEFPVEVIQEIVDDALAQDTSSESS